MEDLIKNGSLLAAVTALVFVIVGLLQWVVGVSKTNDTKRNELLGQIEKWRLECARLKGQLIIYSDKFESMQTQLADYKARYEHFKDLYEACETTEDEKKIPPPTP